MSGGADYQNELQSFWNGLPGEVQEVFDFVYQPVNDALEWVCGDPDDLMRGAAVYTEVGPLVTALADEVADARSAVLGHWEGPDFDAFQVRVAELEEMLTALGEGVSSTTEILEAASEAAVESADAILSIIKMVIAFALSSLAISLALSVLTLGASMVAWAAGQVANAAMALARVSMVTSRMAAFLQRVAALLTRLRELFLRIKGIFKVLSDIVKELRMLSKGKNIVGEKISMSLKERIAWMTTHGGLNAAGSFPINQLPGVQLPGLVGSGIDAAEHGAGAHHASEDAGDR